MKNNSPKALVLCGDGVNCERESAHALTLAGFDASMLTVREFTRGHVLDDAQMLVLPGGFSFGDEVRSGKILSIKIRALLLEALLRYIEAGKLVMGICNGFQVLTQLGLLPSHANLNEREVTLAHNSSGKFQDRWVKLTCRNNESGYFAGLSNIWLPIRHGEGRLVLKSNGDGPSPELVLKVRKHAPLTYDEDVNGSFEKVAALVSDKGTVLGLMPHPECFVRLSQHPAWLNNKRGASDLNLSHDGEPHGLTIFKNARRMIAN